MHRRFRSLAAFAVLAASPAFADTLQSSLVVSGLSSPTFATGAPGDTKHLYVTELGAGGVASIKVIDLTTKSVSTFLTITGVASGGEMGLLGLAFDPNFATNGNFYVDYSATTTISGASSVSTIAAYHATSPTTANPTALGKILQVTQTPQTNHKAGWIGFSNRPGDDHNLYIALGDGGNSNDSGTGHIEPTGNAQNTATMLGKILRVHIDPANPTGYTIPANNPFAGTADPNVKKEIFVYGLRNPFRDSFDRGTGNLFIGDVGQDTREELDVQPITNPAGGENFGWRVREGTIATPTGGVGGAKTAGMTDPILDYPRSPGTASAFSGRTIIGGYVYRGSAIPDLVGTYIFGDELGPNGGSTQIFSLKYDGTTASSLTNLTSILKTGATPIANVYSFAEDTSGELYIVDGGGGRIYKIISVPEPASLSLLLAGGIVFLRRRLPKRAWHTKRSELKL